MNCKDEFLDEVKGRNVLCAQVARMVGFSGKLTIVANLPVGFNMELYWQFLQNLDFEYDDGFGSQEISGCIWYKDGTWSERAEYDGSEWWDFKSCPTIPEELTEPA